MSSEIERRKNLLHDVVYFNLQIKAYKSGLEREFKKDLEKIYLPRIEELKSLDLIPELIVEESLWTWHDKNNRLVSLTQEKHPCKTHIFNKHHLYTCCFSLFSPTGPFWLSQINFSEENTITIYSYPHTDKPWAPHMLHNKKIFISYSKRRFLLAQQIKKYLSQFGVSFWDYKYDGKPFDNLEYLLKHLESEIIQSDAVIYIEDNVTTKTVYTTSESIFAKNKLIRVGIADHSDFDYGGGYMLLICHCHWPEKIRELTHYLMQFFIHETNNQGYIKA